MLKIKNITVKNFMSVGNNTQAVNFDNDQLTLVLGHNQDLGGNGSRNGTGKSTVLNALSYALYGDALTNIKKDNLINKTNGKNMLVTVNFSVNNQDYRIERGRRPNLLKLYANDIDTEQADAGDQQGENRQTQKEIEKIVGIPHNMFKHLIALNTYTEPFLSMRTGDQRAMIEQLLGVTDLSAKAELLKERIKSTRDSIKEQEIHIAAIRSSNERIEKNIQDTENRARAWDRSHQEKIQSLQDAIDQLNQIDIEQELTAHNTNSQTVADNQSRDVLQKELKNIQQSVKRSQGRLEESQSNLESAKQGVCHACGQGTSHLKDHEQYIVDLENKIAAEQSHIDSQTARQAEINSGLELLGTAQKLLPTAYKSAESALEHKHNLETVVRQLEEKRTEQNPYVEQAQSLRESGLQEINFEEINTLTELKEHQDMLYQLLTSKDSFIRKRIIEQNLAYLNSRLAYYLDRIGLPHLVRFNSDLTVDITEFGRDLDFDNLSRGERNRLILSMSWAFRDIYESLNRPINLLFIDELIDSGMDSTGVESALGVLKHMHRESNRNIFLISHKEELIGRVSTVLYVIKTGGFTEYSNNVEHVI